MTVVWKPWTQEEKNHLKERWGKDSAAVIADKIGRSRNGVIGQAHRMDLEIKRVPKVVAPKIKVPAPQHLKPVVPRPKPPPVNVPASSQKCVSDGVPLLETNWYHCRAIIGSTDDGRALAVCCGNTIETGSRYLFCPEHMSIYTIPPRR